MALVLRNANGNKNACKSLITAEYCGVKVEYEKEFQMGDFNIIRLRSNPSEWHETHLFLKNHIFHEKNPVGNFPVLETPDGPLVDSHAMARYIAKLKGDNTLCSSSAFESVQIEQWMGFAATQIDPLLTRWIYQRTGAFPYFPLHETFIIAGMKSALHVLNNHLAPNYYYLLGDRLTLADIVMTCDLYFGFTRIMTKYFTSEFPHVERYFWNLVSQPNFKKILGEVKQTDSLLMSQDWSGNDVNHKIGAQKELIHMLEDYKENVNQMIGPQERVKQMLEAQNKVIQMLEEQKDSVNKELEAQKQRLSQMIEDAEPPLDAKRLKLEGNSMLDAK